MSKHPIQPKVVDAAGVWRFKENAIVRWLAMDKLNEIATMNFPREDHVQLAQLIGYSLSGFGSLSYVKDDDYNAAAAMFDSGVDERDARIDDLTEQLKSLRDGLRAPIAALYGKHPDDLE